VAKTLIDVDEDLMVAAQRILGATTKKETVNLALREVVRREAAVRFLQLARGGVFTPVPGSQRTVRSC
jgi:Arc/MetJ family transcription regulator